MTLHHDNQDAALEPWFQNLPGHTARLALVIHLSRWAAGEQVDPTTCDMASMISATSLAVWIANEAIRVIAHLSVSAHQQDQWDLMDWILKKGGVVSTRDVSRPSRKYPISADAENALNELVSTGIGCWVLQPPGPQGGRPFGVYSLSSGLDGGLPLSRPRSPHPAEPSDRMQYDSSVNTTRTVEATDPFSSLSPFRPFPQGSVNASGATVRSFEPPQPGSVNTPHQPARNGVRFDEQQPVDADPFCPVGPISPIPGGSVSAQFAQRGSR